MEPAAAAATIKSKFDLLAIESAQMTSFHLLMFNSRDCQIGQEKCWSLIDIPKNYIY